jgi:hypothetical protein
VNEADATVANCTQVAFALKPGSVPSFAEMSTAHWPLDQQKQFASAVHGIRSAPWFQTAAGEMLEFDAHRIATAFAFSAFAHLRRRPGQEMAPDAELMVDNRGMGF